MPHRSRSLYAARSFTEDVTRILDAVPALKAYAAGAAAGPAAAAAAAPAKAVQTILFSATLAGWVKDVSRKYMSKPVTVDLVEALGTGAGQASTDVTHLVLQVSGGNGGVGCVCCCVCWDWGGDG